MQQPTENRAPGDMSSSQGWDSVPSTSFAGLLAALTEPAQPAGTPANESLSSKQRPASSWNDDDLADDVAILSYESALKAHARHRPSHVSDRSLTQPANAEPYCYEEASSAASAPCPIILSDPEHRDGESKDLRFFAERVGNQASLGAIPSLEPRATPAPNPSSEPSLYRAAAFERNLKDSSITIRMSKAECAQLHRRAAEAGLTVSAYLRSCTFEAESLRAMVKDTLAQLRTVTAQAKPADAAPSRISKVAAWLARLLTPWHGSQRVARA
jgi:hypothetical protein